MSIQALKEVIERAINDQAFRQQLLNSPDEALAGYTLSDEDRAKLVQLTPDTFDDFAGNLGGRTTKGPWIPGI